MAKKYHITARGDVKVCRAEIQCPFGDMRRDHYSSKDEARKAYENQMGTLPTNRRELKNQISQALEIKELLTDYGALHTQWSDHSLLLAQLEKQHRKSPGDFVQKLVDVDDTLIVARSLQREVGECVVNKNRWSALTQLARAIRYRATRYGSAEVPGKPYLAQNFQQIISQRTDQIKEDIRDNTSPSPLSARELTALQTLSALLNDPKDFEKRLTEWREEVDSYSLQLSHSQEELKDCLQQDAPMESEIDGLDSLPDF